MKRFLSLALAMSLSLAATSAFAIQGGDNQILPGTDTMLPETMHIQWEDVTVSVVPFKVLETGAEMSMVVCIPADNASEDPTARPCIITTRGSGYRAVTVNDFLGKPGDMQLVRSIMLAKQGYVVACVEFRGYTSEPAGIGTFPAALQDVRAAVRYLKANAAEYGIDVNKFAVIGQSSGGYESGMLGVTNGIWGVEVIDDVLGGAMGEKYYSEADADAAIAAGKNVLKLDTAVGDIDPEAINYNSEVIASIDLYGIAKVDEIGKGEFQHTLAANTSQEEVKFMTGRDDIEIWDVPYVHTAANPFWYIDEYDAQNLSMLFIHGLADTRVYPTNTEDFYALAKENNMNAYRYLIPGAGHGGNRFTQDDLNTMFLDFFDETMKGYTGNRVIVCPSENGSVAVTLNGEDVTATPWKLNNLTAADQITVTGVPAEGATCAGLTIETIDDDYVVETKSVYTKSYSFTGDTCVTVTAAFQTGVR